MGIKAELLNKYGLAVVKLAEELTWLRPGDRFPKVADLAMRHSLSVGTIQFGLSFLKNKGVVGLVSKGHLGSFVEFINYGELQEYAGITSKACVMPLPYSLRYEGLATAFAKLGNGLGKFYIAFMNGSGRRIQALLGGRYDCALLSRLAAEAYQEEGLAVEIAASYGPGSFLKEHSLLFRTRSVKDIRTLGLDPESKDQVLLAREFLAAHPKIRVVNLPYARVINRLESGDVDATLWNGDFIAEHNHPSLQHEPLEFTTSHRAITEAVLVIRTGDAATSDYLARNFKKEEVLQIQKAVLAGERIPEY